MPRLPFRPLVAVAAATATLGLVPINVGAQDAALGLGDEGAEVENAQDLLNQFLALSDSDLALIAEDGIFGPNTKAAVEEFEETSERPSDGVLSLGESIALSVFVAELERSTPAIQPGEQGPTVATWQAELNDWNRLSMTDLPIESDGVYGPNSVAATRVFEQAAGLQVDGIVEPEDRAAMRETLADLRADAGDLPPLTLGDAGALVQSAQALLNQYFAFEDLGIGPIAEDGLYGRNTRDAASVFESNEGLTDDGVLTRADIDRLRIRVAELEADAADSVVQLGDRGDLVNTWQRPLAEWLRLSDTDLEPIVIDGVFGQSTYRATTRFERVAGLQVDGVVEPEDRVALREALERLRAEAIEGTVADAETLGEVVTASDFTPADANLLRLYYVFFDREPDVGGARYWIDRSRNDLGYVEIAAFFAASPEFNDTYGTLTNAEFVTLLYRNSLEREPDGEGFEFWVDQLDQGLRSRAEVVRQFGFSPEFVANNPFGGF